MKKRSVLDNFNDAIHSLNNSKFFAGIIMIVMNIGSRFISVKFNKSTEEWIRFGISKQLLVFTMAWMASRDIYASLGLTAVFVVLSEYVFNEESKLCLVPEKYRMINNIIDENGDGVVDEEEMKRAIQILERAKKIETMKNQKLAFVEFNGTKLL